jgi:hypothetical protein
MRHLTRRLETRYRSRDKGLGPAHRAAQHHPDSVAGEMPGTEQQENVWQFIRDNWPSNRIFKSFYDIVDHCCDAWNKLTDQPWRIISIGLRDWAYES